MKASVIDIEKLKRRMRLSILEYSLSNQNSGVQPQNRFNSYILLRDFFFQNITNHQSIYIVYTILKMEKTHKLIMENTKNICPSQHTINQPHTRM